MMLRRTKVLFYQISFRRSYIDRTYCSSDSQVERADDLGLPPRTVIVRRDYFSPEEKELYLSLFSESKRQFSYYVDQGTLLNSM